MAYSLDYRDPVQQFDDSTVRQQYDSTVRRSTSNLRRLICRLWTVVSGLVRSTADPSNDCDPVVRFDGSTVHRFDSSTTQRFDIQRPNDATVFLLPGQLNDMQAAGRDFCADLAAPNFGGLEGGNDFLAAVTAVARMDILVA